MCVKGVFGVSGSESGNFRRSAFGGFNRDDVVGYIEKYSAEHHASLAENEKLRSENGELSLKVSELEGEVEKLKADNSELAGWPTKTQGSGSRRWKWKRRAARRI